MFSLPGLPQQVRRADKLYDSLQVVAPELMGAFHHVMHYSCFSCGCGAIPLFFTPERSDDSNLCKVGRDRSMLPLGEMWVGPKIEGHVLTYLLYVKSHDCVRGEIEFHRGFEGLYDVDAKQFLQQSIFNSKPIELISQAQLLTAIAAARRLCAEAGISVTEMDFLGQFSKASIVTLFNEAEESYHVKVPIDAGIISRLPKDDAVLVSGALTISIEQDAREAAKVRYAPIHRARAEASVEEHSFAISAYEDLLRGEQPIVRSSPMIYLLSERGELLARHPWEPDCTEPKSDLWASPLGALWFAQLRQFDRKEFPKSADGIPQRMWFPEALLCKDEPAFRDFLRDIPAARVAPGCITVEDPTSEMALLPWNSERFSGRLTSLSGGDYDIASKAGGAFGRLSGARLTLETPELEIPTEKEIQELRPAFERLMLRIIDAYQRLHDSSWTPAKARAKWVAERF